MRGRQPAARVGKPWRPDADGELVIFGEGGLNENNPHYLRLRVHTPGRGFGVVNSGFRGMGVEAGAEYVLSAYVRARAGGPRSLSARLTGDPGTPLAEATLAGFAEEWKRCETTLRPQATHARAELEITATEAGEIDIDMVSLYPRDTWKSRPNGLRKDLVQLLADMKPGFLRFPGGCIVEGRRLALRYDWKKTVGDVAERKSLINRWNDEFAHRPAPDYFQSFGLGFFEYFQLAEDVGAALKKAHPEIALVASAGPAAGGPMFDYLWTNLTRLKADVVDEHYYMPPAWLLANEHRYDGYDSSGPKVFAGEYAAQTSGQARPDNRNNREAALAEAAFVTGLERNADVVAMASYAPLLAHVDAWQWTPNLIWFDNLAPTGRRATTSRRCTPRTRERTCCRSLSMARRRTPRTASTPAPRSTGGAPS